MPKVICDYCGDAASLVTGRVIYPHRPDLAHLKFYQCAPCDAYVGTHRNTTQPLGRLANASLRRAKVRAHGAFDPLWQQGLMTRTQAYQWLASAMNLELERTHIGMFDEAQCATVRELSSKKHMDLIDQLSH